MAIEWNPRLALGVDTIDRQLEELFRRVNDLGAALEARRGEAEVRRILSFLGDYVSTHFEAEERLMRHLAYPDLHRHQAFHDAFVKDLGALKARLEQIGPCAATAAQLEDSVCGWLLDHVGGTDRAFAEFLAERAKQQARP